MTDLCCYLFVEIISRGIEAEMNKQRLVFEVSLILKKMDDLTAVGCLFMDHVLKKEKKVMDILLCCPVELIRA